MAPGGNGAAFADPTLGWAGSAYAETAQGGLALADLSPDVLRVFKDTNTVRAEAGRPPLILDLKLCEAAAIRARESVALFDHVRPDGRSYSSVFGEIGIDASWGNGENLAMGYGAKEVVMQGWKNSPGHYDNMIGAYESIGVGIAYDGRGAAYYAQLFAKGTYKPLELDLHDLTVADGVAKTGGAGWMKADGAVCASGIVVKISAGPPPQGMVFKNWASDGNVIFRDTDKATTTFAMPKNAVTVTANYEPVYSLKVKGGASAMGVGSYTAGTIVTITSGTAPPGKQFANWTSSGGGRFADENKAYTTFVMPANPVTITSAFKPSPAEAD